MVKYVWEKGNDGYYIRKSHTRDGMLIYFLSTIFFFRNVGVPPDSPVSLSTELTIHICRFYFLLYATNIMTNNSSEATKQTESNERVSFASLTSNNLGTVRKLHSVIFPIKYSERFYKDIISSDLEDFCKLSSSIHSSSLLPIQNSLCHLSHSLP